MQQLLKKNIFIILILVAIVITVFMTNNSKAIDNTTSDPVELMLSADDPIEEMEVEAEPEEFMIDVKGEVKLPGVYTVDVTDRVIDVILLAGGFTDAADQNQVNLAQKVHDEMVIFIPKPGEIVEEIESIQTAGPESNQADGIRLNSATIEEIQTLNGIGPSKAEAIVSYREENGPFKSVDELLNISGIGEKTLEKFKDKVIVP